MCLFEHEIINGITMTKHSKVINLIITPSPFFILNFNYANMRPRLKTLCIKGKNKILFTFFKLKAV